MSKTVSAAAVRRAFEREQRLAMLARARADLPSGAGWFDDEVRAARRIGRGARHEAVAIARTDGGYDVEVRLRGVTGLDARRCEGLLQGL